VTTGAPPRPARDELGAALLDLRRLHGVDDSTLIGAVEEAVRAAWRAGAAPWPGAEPALDATTGRLRVRRRWRVVSGAPGGPDEISLEAAHEFEAGAEVGAVVVAEVEAPPRVLASAVPVAKAALLALVRVADSGRLRTEALARRGQLVDGIVQRAQRGAVLLRVGPLEVSLPPADQIPGERLRRGQHCKVVLLDVPEGPGGYPALPRVSRSDPLLLRRLLEMEVPELGDGTVEIHAIAREAGRRSKVAVGSIRAGVDPVGACIGPRGVRVGAVTREIQPERVDLIAWAPEPAGFVAAALAPARVLAVSLDPLGRRATVTVAGTQLSLAIGREGQNARLAARLTGWRIDIHGAETA